MTAVTGLDCQPALQTFSLGSSVTPHTPVPHSRRLLFLRHRAEPLQGLEETSRLLVLEVPNLAMRSHVVLGF